MSDFSLEDLANLTDLTARTIRSYIEQGLVPGPESLGRHARYTDEHLHRLKAIHALRRQLGWTLADIRQLLLTLSPQAIEEIAEKGRLPDVPQDAPPKPASTSALAYLKALQSTTDAIDETLGAIRHVMAARTLSAAAPPGKASPPQADPADPVDRLRQGLEHLTRNQPVQRRARAETWRRIPVTPDVELHVRGVPEGIHLERLERIADHIRTILMRG